MATRRTFVRQSHLFPTNHKKPTIGRNFGQTYIDYEEKTSVGIERGGTVKRWEQTYKGIPVYGSVVTTEHNRRGQLICHTTFCH